MKARTIVTALLVASILLVGMAMASEPGTIAYDFFLTAGFALFSGVMYCVFNYATSTKPGDWNWGRAIASIIFGLFIGGVIIYQGTPIQEINWTLMGLMFTSFQGVQLWINGFLDFLWRKMTGHAILENLFK